MCVCMYSVHTFIHIISPSPPSLPHTHTHTLLVVQSAFLEPYSAYYMDTSHNTRRLIVAEGPTEDSVGVWWSMVWDGDVTYIVNLTPQDKEVIIPWSY